MASFRKAALIATLTLGAVVGCNSDTVTIKHLLDDPGASDHKTVRITGTVKQSIAALGYGAYQVDDGTGSILVLSKRSGAPREGAQVDVAGEFRSAFTYGDRTAAAIHEAQRTVK